MPCHARSLGASNIGFEVLSKLTLSILAQLIRTGFAIGTDSTANSVLALSIIVSAAVSARDV